MINYCLKWSRRETSLSDSKRFEVSQIPSLIAPRETGGEFPQGSEASRKSFGMRNFPTRATRREINASCIALSLIFRFTLRERSIDAGIRNFVEVYIPATN